MKKIRRQWIVVIGMLICLPVFAANQISAFRQLTPNKFVIDGTQAFQYRVFTLSNPSRLVIDIEHGNKLPAFYVSNQANNFIDSVRIGQNQQQVLRLVLNLKRNQKPEVVPVQTAKRHSLEIVFADSRVAATRPVYFMAQEQPQPASEPIIPAPPVSMPEAVNVSLPGRSPNIIVVIDPGHGGKDPGATGPRGIREKDVVLKIAQDLFKDINNQPGFTAKMTRYGDYYLTLRQRLVVARRDNADIFIAIHADAYHNGDAHGASVYALSKRGATSEAARWLAQRENASELMGGVDLNDQNSLLKSVLINLSQTASIQSSLEVGKMIINSLDDLTGLHHHKVEQAAFVVLKSPDIPSLLVETGFISNPYEENRLNSSAYQQKIAAALTQGIRGYFAANPPPGTYLARQKSNRFNA